LFANRCGAVATGFNNGANAYTNKVAAAFCECAFNCYVRISFPVCRMAAFHKTAFS